MAPAACSGARVRAIAPWVPHALHMPSHIFTRLGMWNDVIASNLASADAARQYAARHHPQATSFEELHALDYMVYGYLQTARIAGRGRQWWRKAVCETEPAVDFAVSYAPGAVPARYALERRQWSEAAALVAPSRLVGDVSVRRGARRVRSRAGRRPRGAPRRPARRSPGWRRSRKA